MSSIFDSLNSWDVKPYKRMGVTIDEEIYFGKIILKLVEKYKPKLVLDLACANCLISKMVKERLKEVIAIDDWIDDDMNKFVNYVKGRVSVIRNLFPLPFRDSSFDMIYTVLYFYNIPKKNRKERVEEIRRVLKRDGILVLVDLEIVRSMRKDFLANEFNEIEFYEDQGVFISVMRK